MIRRGLWLFPVLFVGLLGASAQISYSFRADGPDYTAANAPFTATQVTRMEMRLQNGSVMQHEVRETVMRDAQGRVFLQAAPVSSNALMPPRQQLALADPVSGVIYQWLAGGTNGLSYKMPALRHLDIRVLSSAEMSMEKASKGATTTKEELGKQEIAGLEATGTRTTIVLPANVIGNTEPLRVVHEVWVSDDLHIPLRELDINPLLGTRTMNTEKIELNAGPSGMFHVPAGVNFVSRDVGASAVTERIAFAKAMNDIKAPETREAAADELVRYAATHEEEANHVAHTLAIRNTHLEDAKRLGDESVQRMEAATAGLTLDANLAGSFNEMFDLAEYWDSLGSVYAAMGDAETAQRYFRDAWSLGGEGLYLDHIAVIEEHAGDKAAALHTLGVALSGKMDERETDQVRRRAGRLGDENLQPVQEPTVIDVAAKRRDGSADFLLLFERSGAAPDVRFLGGDEALKEDAKAIASATYPAQTPDAGPERILRRGHLECAVSGCKLTLLYAWQAEDAAKGSVGQETLQMGAPSR